MEKQKKQSRPGQEGTFWGWAFILGGFGALCIYGTEAPTYGPAHGAIVGGFIMVLIGRLARQIAELQKQVDRLKAEG